MILELGSQELNIDAGELVGYQVEGHQYIHQKSEIFILAKCEVAKTAKLLKLQSYQLTLQNIMNILKYYIKIIIKQCLFKYILIKIKIGK